MNNHPIEMLSVCGVDGKLQPVRFRFEDGEHQLHTVQVTEVVSSKEICYVGIEAILYVCRVRLSELDRLFELKYTVASHRWVLFRIIY